MKPDAKWRQLRVTSQAADKVLRRSVGDDNVRDVLRYRALLGSASSVTRSPWLLRYDTRFCPLTRAQAALVASFA